jgi:hypothetical protein
LQLVDYEQLRIEALCIEINGEYTGVTTAPYLHRIKMDRKQTFDMEGMSGGPVFYLGRRDRNFFVGFAGMIMRGSATSDYVHFIPAEFLIHVALGVPAAA